MESIITYFNSLNLDIKQIGIAAAILLLGTLLLNIFGRFVFGKRSSLNNAASSAIGILFIYTLSIILHSAGAEFENLIAPLPFVQFGDGSLYLFSFQGAHYTVICSEVLSMVILAFLVNLADSWLPKGKNIFTWLFFRCLTVIIGYILHLIVVGLFATYLPEGIVTYAPAVLLGILILLLLTGALKIIVGAVLTTVNPIIGGLYTFFFANVVGKQITKAVLTTVFLCAMVFALEYFGISVISVSSAALMAYIPFGIILVIIWYIVYRVF